MHEHMEFIDSPSRAIATGAVLTIDVPEELGTVKTFYVRCLDASQAEILPAVALPQLADLKVIVDTDAKWDIDINDLEKIDTGYYNLDASDRGIIMLDQVPRHFEQPKAAEHLQLGTKGLQNGVSVQITCATITNIAFIELYGKRADYDQNPNAVRCFVQMTGKSFNVAGKNLTLTGLIPSAQTTAILAVHVRLNGGVLNKMGFNVNGVEKIKPIPYSVIKGELIAAGRNVHADFASIDFCTRNLMEDQIAIGGIANKIAGFGDAKYVVPPVSSLSLLTNWSTLPGAGSNQTDVIIEYVETVPVTKPV